MCNPGWCHRNSAGRCPLFEAIDTASVCQVRVRAKVKVSTKVRSGSASGSGSRTGSAPGARISLPYIRQLRAYGVSETREVLHEHPHIQIAVPWDPPCYCTWVRMRIRMRVRVRAGVRVRVRVRVWTKVISPLTTTQTLSLGCTHHCGERLRLGCRPPPSIGCYGDDKSESQGVRA